MKQKGNRVELSDEMKRILGEIVQDAQKKPIQTAEQWQRNEDFLFEIESDLFFSEHEARSKFGRNS